MIFKWAGLAFLIAAVLLLGGCEKPTVDGLLVDFEDPAQLDRLIWRCGSWFELAPSPFDPDKKSLLARLGPEKYPTIDFYEFPRNWKGYSGLEFWAFAPSSPGEKLYLRVDDKSSGPGYEDRFNFIFTLGEKPAKYCAPLFESNISPNARKIDPRKIKVLMFFLYDQKQETTLYLDDIRLVKSCGEDQSG